MDNSDSSKRGPSPQPQAASAVIERQVQKRIFKIIVIGDSNVGKTCLTFRFCGGRFPEKTEATIGVDFREKTVEISGELVKASYSKKGYNCRSLPITLKPLFKGPVQFLITLLHVGMETFLNRTIQEHCDKPINMINNVQNRGQLTSICGSGALG